VIRAARRIVSKIKYKFFDYYFLLCILFCCNFLIEILQLFYSLVFNLNISTKEMMRQLNAFDQVDNFFRHNRLYIIIMKQRGGEYNVAF